MTDRSPYYLADRNDMERHRLAFMDAFCGCEDCAAARKEQSVQASGSPALDGQAQTGRLPYTNQSHKEFDGDISKLMGALA